MENALGHILTADGAITKCYEQAVRAAWRSFWANVGAACLKRYSVKMKLARLDKFVLPIFRYRWTRWPYQVTMAAQLDALQRRMIGIVLSLRKLTDETPECFVRRRGRASAHVQRTTGQWSKKWAAVVSWHEHVHRPRNNKAWIAGILHIRTPQELAFRRASTGRPQCRSLPGFIRHRWFESVEAARSHL